MGLEGEQLSSSGAGPTSVEAEEPIISRRRIEWRLVLQGALLGLALVLGWTVILSLDLIPSRVHLAVGDVAPFEAVASRGQSFQSAILTQRARERAAQAIGDLYRPLDPAIGRRQIARLMEILESVSSARQRPSATFEERVASIQAISELSLPLTMTIQALSLGDEAWQQVVTETVYVLEQVMRQEVRSDSLLAVRSRIPGFVRRDLSMQQAELIIALVRDLTVPNVLYDAKGTEQARQEAQEAIKPVMRTVKRGEVILRKGEVVDALHLEALGALGLTKTKVDWPGILGHLLFVLMAVSVLALYILRTHQDLWVRQRRLVLLAVLLFIPVLAARLMVPEHVILRYLVPTAAVPMVLSLLLGPDLSIMAITLVSLAVGLLGTGSLELTVYTFAGGAIASLTLWRAQRFKAFLHTGLYLALANVAISLAFRLSSHDYDTQALITLAAAGVVNSGLSVSLTMGGLFLIGSLSGITTAFQLMDLAQATQPALRRLLLRAPGTYHHSLVVANMAEGAAEAIGADALLARVGAYYHDLGKVVRPWFFTENQLDGVNVHEQMKAKASAEVIISHVRDGLKLARRYGLPPRLQDFIPQHHGTMLATYFYHQALKQAREGEEVREEDFRYPGPKPQGRETAIVMLADGCEAAVRSAHPTSIEEIEAIIHEIIAQRLSDGQLNECDLELRDLDRIRGAFQEALQGLFHPRVPYPPAVEPAQPKEEAPETRPKDLPSGKPAEPG